MPIQSARALTSGAPLHRQPAPHPPRLGVAPSPELEGEGPGFADDRAALGERLPFPNLSGMALTQDDRLLVVSDRKLKGGEEAPHLGLLQAGPEGVAVQPLALQWGEETLPNDLEACATLAGSEGEYLLAESGHRGGEFGRIFRIGIEGDQALLRAVFEPREAPEGETPSHEQIEGMATFSTRQGQTILVLGQRGGEGHPGQLTWGALQDDRFSPLGSATLDLRELLPEARSCSELLLLPDADGGWQVLSVASTDEGDYGPFSSAVAEVGRFVEDPDGSARFEPCPPRLLHRLEGHKVEALAPSPSASPGGPLCVGTDDEALGAIWQTLPGGLLAHP